MVHWSLLQFEFLRTIRLSRETQKPPSLRMTLSSQVIIFPKERRNAVSTDCAGHLISSTPISYAFSVIQLLPRLGLLGCSSSARPRLQRAGKVQTKVWVLTLWDVVRHLELGLGSAFSLKLRLVAATLQDASR